MLQECIAVFQKILEEQGGGEKRILDEYVPADGTYLLVSRDGNIQVQEEIKFNKTTKQVEGGLHFREFCFWDYHSRLISMNKPVDSKKIIHSNNYFSFWIKKDNLASKKLTLEIIDGYYDTLADPIGKKYGKSKEAIRIYQKFEEKEGAVDQDKLERCRQWIKEHIFSLDGVDLSKKDYLKIFFEAEEEEYIREDRRYILPNIYNNNEYNVEINGEIFGLPDNNLGMNAKKPFLSIKTRKYPAPYLLNENQIIQQKYFFDYLANQAASGRFNIYVDTDKNEIHPCEDVCEERIDSGYFLRLKKGKETEIPWQDNLSGYKQEMDVPFLFKNFTKTEYKKHPEYTKWIQMINQRKDFRNCINDVVFWNYLNGNLWMKAADVSAADDKMRCDILMAREAIREWSITAAGRDQDSRLEKVLDSASLNSLKRSVLENQSERTIWQLNFRWSCKEYFSQKEDESVGRSACEVLENVKKKILSDETVYIEENHDKEYYFAVGQLVAYLISLSKSGDRNQALINQFLNVANNDMLRQKLTQLYTKYNYAISDGSKRVKNLLAMIMAYVPDQPIDAEMFIWGYAANNIVYTKEDKK